MPYLYLLSVLSGTENPDGNVTLQKSYIERVHCVHPQSQAWFLPSPNFMVPSLPTRQTSWSMWRPFSPWALRIRTRRQLKRFLFCSRVRPSSFSTFRYAWGGISHRASPLRWRPGSWSRSTPGTRSRSGTGGGRGTDEWGLRWPHSHPYYSPSILRATPWPAAEAQPGPQWPTPAWKVLALMQGQRAIPRGEGHECLEQQLWGEGRILQQGLYWHLLMRRNAQSVVKGKKRKKRGGRMKGGEEQQTRWQRRQREAKGWSTSVWLKFSSSHICTVDTCSVWFPNCSSARPSHVHCSRRCGPMSRTGWFWPRQVSRRRVETRNGRNKGLRCQALLLLVPAGRRVPAFSDREIPCQASRSQPSLHLPPWWATGN